MSAPDFEAKKAYFAKVRRRNYAASLRLEGMAANDGFLKYASRQDAVLAHTRQVKAKS